MMKKVKAAAAGRASFQYVFNNDIFLQLLLPFSFACLATDENFHVSFKFCFLGDDGNTTCSIG